MRTEEFISHVFAGVWYVIVVAAVSAVIYLFLNGSSIFSWNKERVSVRLFIEERSDTVFVSGSFTPLSPCAHVVMEFSDTPSDILLTTHTEAWCDYADPAPVTFVSELPKIAPEHIRVFLDGRRLPIIMQQR